MTTPPIRILLAKPGLDVHDRGIRIVARACRDAGMEVILLGTGILTVTDCVATAIQEDVDVVGLSIMTGQPEQMTNEALAELKARNAAEVPLVLGGVIRQDKIQVLKDLGVAAIFTAGTPLDRITQEITQIVAARRATQTSG